MRCMYMWVFNLTALKPGAFRKWSVHTLTLGWKSTESLRTQRRNPSYIVRFALISIGIDINITDAAVAASSFNRSAKRIQFPHVATRCWHDFIYNYTNPQRVNLTRACAGEFSAICAARTEHESTHFPTTTRGMCSRYAIRF